MISPAKIEQLLANGRTQRAARERDEPSVDFKPVIKIFTPDAQCTWLLTEMDADGIAYGLCDLGHGTPELGYISLAGLAAIRGRLGLPIEVDISFVPEQTLDGYANAARQEGRILA